MTEDAPRTQAGMDKLAGYVEVIRESYPDLEVRSTTLLTAGSQFNDILILNGELVFRFPRYPKVAQALAVETAVLLAIGDRLPLQVPNPIYRSKDTEATGRAFVGYRLIPGEPLSRDMLASFDPETMRRLAVQLAGFLRALHRTPPDAIPVVLPLADGHSYWADMYDRVRARLYGHMRPDAGDWATRHFESFLADDRNFAYAPALRHGDFGGANILYDERARAAAGVIDFSSVALGDPAVDLAALLATVGDDVAFLQSFFDTYPELEPGLPRARFYRGTFALQEALYGIEDGDQEAFRNGIAEYI